MRHLGWMVALIKGLYELVREIGTFRTSKPTGPSA